MTVHDFMGEEGWLSREDVAKIEEVVKELTSVQNKDKQHGYHVLKLNAEQQIINWKNELTNGQIEEIRRDTQAVWRMFYDDSDW